MHSIVVALKLGYQQAVCMCVLAGYVMACAAVRLAAKSGMSIDRAVRRFAAMRPPGIYKDSYIADLFRWVLLVSFGAIACCWCVRSKFLYQALRSSEGGRATSVRCICCRDAILRGV
jgi:hypothetical protein